MNRKAALGSCADPSHQAAAGRREAANSQEATGRQLTADRQAAVDRRAALDAFDDYVSAYDPANPRIALKIDHTLRVADLCSRIAEELGLEGQDADLAWMLGLLHDIGRFEQVRRFDTFNDAASVNHAALGAEVLFDGDDGGVADGGVADGGGVKDPRKPLVRLFLPDDTFDVLVRTAVETHSAYRLPESLDERTRMFCQILRDADKVDILKVNCTCPIEDIYGVPEMAMRDSELSPACVDVFYEHRCLPRGVRRHPADIMLGHICFAWELVYEPSLQIVREQGYLQRMLDYAWSLPATRDAFARMASHMEQHLHVAR